MQIGSPFAPPILPNGNKKARKTVTLEIQKHVWDTHIGTGMKESPCPLCGEALIRSPTSRCGLELAHIVADKWFSGKLSPLSLYPSCSACNNRCEDDCLLDFLFRIGRHKQLERLIVAVHGLYCVMNPNQPPERLLMHNVIDSLYGWERYKSGGGIYNDVEIYNFARMVHIKQLNKEMDDITRQLRNKADEMQLVSTNIPTRKRPPSII